MKRTKFKKKQFKKNNKNKIKKKNIQKQLKKPDYSLQPIHLDKLRLAF